MRKDLHNNIKFVSAFNSATISTNTTTNGNIIDLQGYNAVEFIIISGTLTDGSYTPVITEGDASNLSDGQTVTNADNLFGTTAGATFALTDDNTIKRIGYRVGPYRYVRLSLTSASVTSGGVISAVAALGNPDQLPTT